MFDNEPSQTPQAQPGKTAAAPQDFHTMPERFMDAGSGAPGAPLSPKSSGGMGKKLMIAAVSAVVLGGLGAGAWYYFVKMQPSNENTNVAAGNTNTVNATTNTVLNQNLNANTNAVTNLNANANTNVSGNLNFNLNLNTNSNLNFNLNTNTSLTTTGSPLPASTDTDSDGLTDIEEPVFGTLTSNSDTDADGFIDGMRTLANGKIEGEAYSGYCPVKSGSVKIDDASCGVLRTYTNTTYNYAIWVPKNWLTQATAGDDKTVIITPDIATAEFFQVQVLDNPSQLTAKSYYLSLNPGVDSSMLKDASVNGLDGVMSLDESTVYFVKGTKIYIINYNTDSLTRVNFRTTFSLMFRNFRLTAPVINTNTNTTITTNTNT